MRENVCIGSICSLVDYMFNINQDVSDKSVATRNFIETFIKICINVLLLRNDNTMLIDLLGVMDFNLFSSIVLAEDCLISFQWRIKLFNEYIGVHFQADSVNMLKTCESINLNMQNELQFLHYSIVQKYLLDEKKFFFHPYANFMIHRNPTVDVIGSNLGVFKTVSASFVPGQLIMERNLAIYLTKDEFKSLIIKGSHETPFCFKCDFKIPDPSFTATGSPLSHMNLVPITLEMSINVRDEKDGEETVKRKYYLDCRLECKACEVEVKCVMDAYLYFKDGVEKVQRKSMELSKIRKLIKDKIDMNYTNVFHSFDIEGDKRKDRHVIPFRLVFVIEEIKLRV
jgi:hypothetical protein